MCCPSPCFLVLSVLPRDVSQWTANIDSSFEGLTVLSALRTYQKNSVEVINTRLRDDMGNLVASANAELNLFNDKLSGQ